jgi:hypothetical protein
MVSHVAGILIKTADLQPFYSVSRSFRGAFQKSNSSVIAVYNVLLYLADCIAIVVLETGRRAVRSTASNVLSVYLRGPR